MVGAGAGVVGLMSRAGGLRYGADRNGGGRARQAHPQLGPGRLHHLACRQRQVVLRQAAELFGGGVNALLALRERHHQRKMMIAIVIHTAWPGRD